MTTRSALHSAAPRLGAPRSAAAAAAISPLIAVPRLAGDWSLEVVGSLARPGM